MPGTFTFDGRDIPIEPGDTLGSALHRSGTKVISRSLKYHRPRGLYCCTGSCASCFVNVDGIPNVPACMAPAAAGTQVTSQNRLGSAQHDLLGVVDKVYRKGFDPHGAFTKPRILNRAFLVAVRMMSGLGKAPKSDVAPSPRRHTLHVDEIIVGAGLHGLRRAREACRPGRRVLLVDELPGLGGSARWDAGEEETRHLAHIAPSLPGIDVWTNALAFGIYGTVVAIRRDRDLWEVTADRITIAPGQYDAWPMFENNDLPGVFSLRGARRLTGEHKLSVGKRVAVHGARLPDDFAAALRGLGASVVGQGLVEAARGGTEVTAARIDDKWIGCDAIVCNIPGTPRVELFQQAGCKLGWQGGVLGPERTAGDGTTSRAGLFALFTDVAPGQVPFIQPTPVSAGVAP